MQSFFNVVKSALIPRGSATGTSTHGLSVSLDLTEEDNEQQPAIRIEAVTRPTHAAGAPSLPAQDHESHNYWQNPFEGRGGGNGAFHIRGRQLGAMEEEARLLGSAKAPRSAIAIAEPGSAMPSPALRRAKPGSRNAFAPRDTLKSEPFRSKGLESDARPNNSQRHRQTTRNLYSKSTSPPQSGSPYLSIDDRDTKRRKIDTTRDNSARDMDVRDDSLHQAVPEIFPQQIGPDAADSDMERRRLRWEVSGKMESRLVDMMLTREKNRNAHQSQQPFRGLSATGIRKQATRIPNSCPDLLVDQDAPGWADEARARNRRRTALRRRLADEGDIDSTSYRQTAVDEGSKSSVSHYFKDPDKRSAGYGYSNPPNVENAHAARPFRSDLTGQTDSLREGRSSAYSNVPDEAKHDEIEDSGDELHHSTARARYPRLPAAKSRGSTRPSAPSKAAKDNQNYQLEKFCNAQGLMYKGHHFFQLHLLERTTSTFIQVDGSQRGMPPSLVIDIAMLQKSISSINEHHPWLRLTQRGAGQETYNFWFHDFAMMKRFIQDLQNKRQNPLNHQTKPLHWLELTFKDFQEKMAEKKVVAPNDDGEDPERSERKTGLYRGSIQPSRKGKEASRATSRTTILSNLRSQSVATDSKFDAAHRRIDGIRFEDQELDRDPEETDPAVVTSALAGTRRTTRRMQKLKSPTPEAISKYSEVHGLGEKWDQPVVYPEAGKKRATVDWEDLQRLDDGEFLNDSLIEFYIRWLHETFPESAKLAYFFSTHFYTKLTGGKASRARKIDYDAVARWTAKDDLFKMDYVVVPVNEDAHWYLAIICNLPNVERKLAGEDEATQDNVEAEILVAENEPAEGSASHPVDLDHSIDAPSKAPRQDMETNAKLVEDSPHLKRIAPGSPSSVIALDENASSALQSVTGTQLEEDEETSRTIAIEAPASQPSLSNPNSAATNGVFDRATPFSPEKTKRNRRKSGPGPKKIPEDKPTIIILDSLGLPHQKTISNLKDYLIAEAEAKRGMAIDDKNVFRGMNARDGIPTQENYWDCGIFVCGYLHQFVINPREFVRKTLQHEFDIQNDWPEMKPQNMRAKMRETIMNIAKEQKEARMQRKAAKRARKAAEADGGSGLPIANLGIPVASASGSPTRQAKVEDLRTRSARELSTDKAQPSSRSTAPSSRHASPMMSSGAAKSKCASPANTSKEVAVPAKTVSRRTSPIKRASRHTSPIKTAKKIHVVNLVDSQDEEMLFDAPKAGPTNASDDNWLEQLQQGADDSASRAQEKESGLDSRKGVSDSGRRKLVIGLDGALDEIPDSQPEREEGNNGLR